MLKPEGIQTSGYKILVLQGPNLNLLGHREPGIYGTTNLEELHLKLEDQANREGIDIQFFQSNHEGELIDRIHEARLEEIDGIILNAGGFTHTSVALADALAGVMIPYIEIHISNVHAREEFRHHSYLSAGASGIIVGLGIYGYHLAFDAITEVLNGRKGEGE